MLPSSNSTGVQPSNLADTTTTPATDESTRTRFPPLADDYDIYSLNVIDLLDYLSELSFSRELKLTTARCYRRWLAAYLEEADHPDAKHVRYWVIPHSPEYYDLLMSATDRLEADKIAAAKRAENKTRTDQLDMFAMLSPNNPDTESADSDTDLNRATPSDDFVPFDKDEIMQMMFETRQIKESAPIAEYDYVSSDVADIFTAALTSKTASGKHRYKHGSLAAALFTGTIMTRTLISARTKTSLKPLGSKISPEPPASPSARYTPHQQSTHHVSVPRPHQSHAAALKTIPAALPGYRSDLLC